MCKDGSILAQPSAGLVRVEAPYHVSDRPGDIHPYSIISFVSSNIFVVKTSGSKEMQFVGTLHNLRLP